MNMSIEGVFGLSSREEKVLKSLRHDVSTTVTALTDIIDPRMPRTTVGYVLKKLESRGLAQRVRVGGHREWRKITSFDAAAQLMKVAQALVGIEEIGKTARGTRVRVTFVKGKRGVRGLMNKIIKAGRESRVYFIQGNVSLEYGLQKVPSAAYLEYHEQLRRNKVIIEGVVGERILEIIQSLDDTLLESHLNRMVVAYLLPDEFMEFDLDVAVLNKEVAIVHWEDETVITLESVELASMLRRLIGFAEAHAKKVDLNALIREELEARRKKTEK